jgi:hypothetical protein
MAGSGTRESLSYGGWVAGEISAAGRAGWFPMRNGRHYNFWGTIGVNEVRDFEAAFLVQSHCSHRREVILDSVAA